MKGEYKTITGTDYQAPGAGSNKRDKKESKKENKPPKEQKQQKQTKESATEGKDDDKKKQTRLGMEATKEESLSDWYSQVRYERKCIHVTNILLTLRLLSRLIYIRHLFQKRRIP